MTGSLNWEPVEPPSRVLLQGEHVLLRPVDAAADAKPFFAATHPPAAEESIWRYMFDGPYKDAAEMRQAMEWAEATDDPLRQHMVIKDRNRDTAWFAILDGDWPRLRSAFEAWLAPENFDAQGQQRRSLEQCRGG